MIRYTLRCENGHAFESWFQSGAAFDAQAASSLIVCPVCQSSAIAKDIMAPALARGGKQARNEPAPIAPDSDKGQDLALLGDAAGRRSMIVELRRRILERSADLGPKFAEEALKIHHGLVPDRPIHGQASAEEARMLVEEGVDIMPIPRLPGELN